MQEIRKDYFPNLTTIAKELFINDNKKLKKINLIFDIAISNFVYFSKSTNIFSFSTILFFNNLKQIENIFDKCVAQEKKYNFIEELYQTNSRCTASQNIICYKFLLNQIFPKIENFETNIFDLFIIGELPDMISISLLPEIDSNTYKTQIFNFVVERIGNLFLKNDNILLTNALNDPYRLNFLSEFKNSQCGQEKFLNTSLKEFTAEKFILFAKKWLNLPENELLRSELITHVRKNKHNKNFNKENTFFDEYAIDCIFSKLIHKINLYHREFDDSKSLIEDVRPSKKLKIVKEEL